MQEQADKFQRSQGEDVTEVLGVREKRRAARRAEILRESARLFFEKGYGRTSMDDIVNRVGGSKRTLYTHFGSKEDLFSAFVSDVSARVLSSFDMRLEGNVEKALCSLGMEYMRVLLSPDMLKLYRVLVSEAPFFPELSKNFFDNGPERIANRLAEFLTLKHREELIRVTDPKTTALLFIGMLRSDHHLAAVLTGKRLPNREIRKSVSAAVKTLIGGAIELRPQIDNRLSCGKQEPIRQRGRLRWKQGV
jgi:TetR/AcrR family transcriptional regulator, mexJK operon transcriptional repressor